MVTGLTLAAPLPYLSTSTSIHEIRSILRDYNLEGVIKTAGKGRTKKVIIEDFNAIMRDRNESMNGPVTVPDSVKDLNIKFISMNVGEDKGKSHTNPTEDYVNKLCALCVQFDVIAVQEIDPSAQRALAKKLGSDYNIFCGRDSSQVKRATHVVLFSKKNLGRTYQVEKFTGLERSVSINIEVAKNLVINVTNVHISQHGPAETQHRYQLQAAANLLKGCETPVCVVLGDWNQKREGSGRRTRQATAFAEVEPFLLPCDNNSDNIDHIAVSVNQDVTCSCTEVVKTHEKPDPTKQWNHAPISATLTVSTTTTTTTTTTT